MKKNCLIWTILTVFGLSMTFMIMDLNRESLGKSAQGLTYDNRRFLDLLRRGNMEQFKAKVNDYE